MTRFLLDTGIVGDYLNRRFGVYERAQSEIARGNRIGLGLPGLAEVVAGLERSETRDRNLQRLRAALPGLTLWPLDQGRRSSSVAFMRSCASLAVQCKSSM